MFRAIENQRAVARGANTGVSMLIDPYGRKRQTMGVFRKAILNGGIALRSSTTFHT